MTDRGSGKFGKGGRTSRACAEVHGLSLLVSAAERSRLAGLTSADEAAALAKMASARRERTLVAWAMRRVLLARALDCEPGDIVFGRTESGTPRLVSPHRSLHFSLSHSCDAMLFAFCQTGRVGVDIERVDERVDPAR